MPPDIRRRIVVRPDNTATLERRMIIPAHGDVPEAERVLETKRTSAQALVPSHANLDPLPPNCCFYRGEEGVHVYVIEEEPKSARTIFWNTQSSVYAPMHKRLLESGIHRLWGISHADFAERLRTQTQFELTFPYILKVFRFVGDSLDSVSLWYRTRPVRTERDELLDANLPNRCDQSEKYGQCCFSEDLWNRLAENEITHVGQIRTFLREFWTSAWNDHWVDLFLKDAERMPEVASPWEWEQASKNDPRFMLKLPWRPTGKTVGSLVRALLGQSDPTTRRLFPLFAKRMLAADSFDRTPAKEDAGYRVSPAETILVRDVNGAQVDLAIGNVLVWNGGRHTIEWFGRPDIDGSRLIKFREREVPETLIVADVLHDATIIAEEASQDAVTIGEISISPSVRFRFSESAWPHRERCLYQIKRVKRDAARRVLVRIVDEEHDTVIGEGDTLYPGVTVVFPEPCDEDGFITARMITFADGETLKVGTRIFARDGTEMYEDAIKGFLPIDDEGAHRFILDASGDEFVCEDENGLCDDNILRSPDEPINEVVLPNGATVATVRIGDFVEIGSIHYAMIHAFSPEFVNGFRAVKVNGEWQGLTEHGSLLVKVFAAMTVTPRGVRVGDTFYPVGMLVFDSSTKCVRRVSRFVASGVVGNVVVQFDDGAQEVFAQQFKLVPQFSRVWRAKKTAGGHTVRRGMLLRLQKDVKEIKAGTTLRVSHIVVSENKDPHVVCEDGHGFSLTDAWLAYFEKQVKGKWRRIIARDVPSTVAYKPGEWLAPGVRARYLGGDNDCSFDFQRHEKAIMQIPLTMVRATPSDASLWVCQFDTKVPGGHTGNGVTPQGCCQNIFARYLQRIGEISVAEQRFTDGYATTIVPDHVELVSPGRVVGDDCNGHSIKIGDRVRVHRVYRESSARAYECAKKGTIFTVVHRIARDVEYCLFDAHEDVGQGIWKNLHGFDNIPEHLRHNPAWWSRLALAQVHDCELVD